MPAARSSFSSEGGPGAGAGVLLGGALMSLAALAPWATNEGTSNQRGLNRVDGAITGLLGAVVVGLGAMTLGRRADHRVRGATILLATIGLEVGIAKTEIFGDAIVALSPTAHAGTGSYLLIAGSVLAIAGAWPRRSEPVRARTLKA